MAIPIALAAAMTAPLSPAAEPWPAESNGAAVKLTGIDAGLNTVNWSGASWNPATRTLWLACNSGYFWALVENGAGSFRVATNAAGTKAKWSPGGDLESICQADLDQLLVYLMDENGWIREYDVSTYGVVVENRNWNIQSQCPETGGSGPEGLTFVPDDWLRREAFRTPGGSLYTSTNGMGGLMFVGHQSGGYVHVFDLNRANNGFGYIGRYLTGQSETAGLEFDRENGKLWIWHNTGVNYAEVTELNSYVSGADRRLQPIVEYSGPRSGNLEGLAIVPTAETNNWCFVTDDDNASGEAVVWYRQFAPSEDVDADSLPDGWELRHFGALTQTVGSADSDLDGMSNADESVAGTDPTNRASLFAILGTTVENNAVALSWHSASGRVYAIEQATDLGIGFTQVVQSSIAANPPVNSTTVDVSNLPGGAFHRVSVQAP